MELKEFLSTLTDKELVNLLEESIKVNDTETIALIQHIIKNRKPLD